MSYPHTKFKGHEQSCNYVEMLAMRIKKVVYFFFFFFIIEGTLPTCILQNCGYVSFS